MKGVSLSTAGLFLVILGSQLQEAFRNYLPGAGDFVLEILTGFTLVAAVVESVREPRAGRLGPDVLAVRFAVLFVLASVLAYLLAKERQGGFFETQKLLAVVLLFFLIARIASTPARVKLFLLAIMLSTCLSAGISVLTVATGKPIVVRADATDSFRLAGGGGDPLMSSHSMMAGAAVAAILLLRTRRWRAVGLVTIALGLAGVVFTYSRSTAVICAALAVWLVFKERRNRRLPALAVPLAVTALAIVAMAPEAYSRRFSNMATPGRDWTLDRRLGYHIVALDLVQTRPLLGVGPGNFAVEYLDPKYRGVPGRTLEPRDLHNMYLGVLVETGAVGFVFFAGLIVAALAGLQRTIRDASDAEVRVAAEATHFALVGFLVACSVVPAQDSKYTWILLGIAAALSRPEFRTGSIRPG